MSTIIQEKPADVVVLGLGFSGPAVATELALAGYSVVGIEKGPYWDFEANVGLTKYDEWGSVGLQKFDNPYPGLPTPGGTTRTSLRCLGGEAWDRTPPVTAWAGWPGTSTVRPGVIAPGCTR